MTIIRSRAPFRIEFGGGGTDISEYFEKHGGFVLNATINKYAYVSLLNFEDGIKINLENKNTVEFPNLKSIKYEGDFDLVSAIVKKMQIEKKEIFLRSDNLPDSGLGTNGAIACAVLGSIYKHKGIEIKKEKIAEEAYQIALNELKISGGKQNQYASAFGGINTIEFRQDGTTLVTPIKINKNTLRELEKHLILVYVGRRLNPNNILREQGKESTKANKIETLNKLKTIAIEMKTSLEKGDTIKFAQLMEKAWITKKEFNPKMTTHYIDHIYDIAKKSGAIGGRIIGAGGGGHMLFYADSNKEAELSKKLQENGARVVDFSFDIDGLEVWEAQK